MQETQVRSLGQEDPLEKEMQPTPVFLPGKSPGQRGAWWAMDHSATKESDRTEPLNINDMYSHETSYEQVSCLSFWFLVVFIGVSQVREAFVRFSYTN